MIITLLLKLLIMIFGFIASFVGGLLPSLPTEIKTVLDSLFVGLNGAVSFIILFFDVNLLKVLFTFWLLVWGVQHTIEFIVWIILGRAKVE